MQGQQHYVQPPTQFYPLVLDVNHVQDVAGWAGTLQFAMVDMDTVWPVSLIHTTLRSHQCVFNRNLGNTSKFPIFNAGPGLVN